MESQRNTFKNRRAVEEEGTETTLPGFARASKCLPLLCGALCLMLTTGCRCGEPSSIRLRFGEKCPWQVELGV